MKRIALLTTIVGLFFGALASVSAKPPQYYVRWVPPVTYTCTHSDNQYHLLITPTHVEYDAETGMEINEIDITSNSVGHFTTGENVDFLTNWQSGYGSRLYTTFTVDSLSYPIMLQVQLRTIVDNSPVYESTLTARCTANWSHPLFATIVNTDHPVYLQALSIQNLGVYHP